MAKQSPATDFDDAELEEQTRPESSRPAPKDEDGVPYCVKHHCRMKLYHGGKAGSQVAYCKCPVDGCGETGKRLKAEKPERAIPAEPLLCPRCSGLTPRPIMERDAVISTQMYSILKCTCCGHKSQPMPRPEFVASHAKARGVSPAEELGRR